MQNVYTLKILLFISTKIYNSLDLCRYNNVFPKGYKKLTHTL